MVRAIRNQDLPVFRGLREEFCYDPFMDERKIRSEARGPHWVAWIADANGKPEGSVVLVAATREDAEERARKWAAQTARDAR